MQRRLLFVIGVAVLIGACARQADQAVSIAPSESGAGTQPEEIESAYDPVALFEKLKSGDQEDRVHAALLLSTLAPGAQEVVPHLTDALDDPDLEVRVTATWALGRFGKEARPAAVALVNHLDDEAVNWAIGEALKNITDYDASDLLAQIPLTTEDPAARELQDRSSAKGAGEAGARTPQADDTAAQGPLNAPEYREALRLIRPPLPPDGPEDSSATSKFDPRVEAGLIRACMNLARLRSIPSRPPFPDYTVAALIKALTDENRWVRWSAAHALGKAGSAKKEVIEGLTSALSDEDNNRLVRAEAAIALGNLGPAAQTAKTPLENAAVDEDAFVRLGVSEALERIDGQQERLLDTLRETLKSEDPLVRWAALLTAERIGPRAAAAASAIETIRQDRNEFRVIRGAPLRPLLD